MTGINEINTAVYRVLRGSDVLRGLCSIYKSEKRPSKSRNPALTVSAKRLEPGEGEGMWMCDIIITVYADLLANRTPDYGTHSEIGALVRELLADRELTLGGAKALPLIEGESTEPKWESVHEHESAQEITFGLVFVRFV